MIADGHSLYEALAVLHDEASVELARRFAALTEEDQLRLWEEINLEEFPNEIRGNERKVARLATESAGWSDLAAAWPP